MKRRTLFFLSLSLSVGIGLSIIGLSHQQAAEQDSGKQSPHPLTAINQKAESAKHGDVLAAEQLVSEVIQVTGFESELRGFAADRIKDRVGRSESLYRQGKIKGISEAKVARTINGLAIKFNLPEFAKTNSSEVIQLRVALYPHFPRLIKLGAEETAALSKGTRSESLMSPAESVLILGMMIHQKMANESYQLTHTERIDNWKNLNSSKVTDEGSLSESTRKALTKNRTQEFREAINRGVASASFSDAWQLSDMTLNTLGIKQ